MGDGATTYSVDAAAKAIEILKFLVEKQGPFRLTDIAEGVGITRSRTRRLLCVLINCEIAWQWRGMYQIHPGFRQRILTAIANDAMQQWETVNKIEAFRNNIANAQNGRPCRFETGHETGKLCRCESAMKGERNAE